jgi:hypothetical protein
MLDLLKDITWLSLKNPLTLSVILTVFMQLIGKPVITLLYLMVADALAKRMAKRAHLEPDNSAGTPGAVVDLKALPAKPNGVDVLINLVTFGFAWLIVGLQVSAEFSTGDAFVTALAAAAFSILEYEGTKNAITALGLKWW